MKKLILQVDKNKHKLSKDGWIEVDDAILFASFTILQEFLEGEFLDFYSICLEETYNWQRTDDVYSDVIWMLDSIIIDEKSTFGLSWAKEIYETIKFLYTFWKVDREKLYVNYDKLISIWGQTSDFEEESDSSLQLDVDIQTYEKLMLKNDKEALKALIYISDYLWT